MSGIGLVVLATAFSLIFVNTAFAQMVNDQVSISGDLENNPVAQDILKKIEKSKRWIENIQQRNAETLEKQRELEEKRAEVLQYLQNDLKKWEELWEYYTFDKMLERAMSNHPSNSTDTIYDHPLKFTASKINAGREALSKVIENGGGPEEARDAFVDAAKITRAEMLSANILFNVLNGNAYYNQQILFESDGQFDETLSGEELRKYYQDYRTNPEYLQANPFDKISWEELGKNNPATECREGYALVYRTHADDYVCTTEYTAEMWIRHDMGVVVDENFEQNKAVDIKQLEQDKIEKKIENLNSKLISLQEYYENKISDTKTKYDLLFEDLTSEKLVEEKRVLERLRNNELSKDATSKEIADIREKYDLLKQNTHDEQEHLLNILEEQHIQDMDEFVRNYEHDYDLKLIWNSDSNTFDVSKNGLY